MKLLLGLVLGVIIGAAVVFFTQTHDSKSRAHSAVGELESASKNAGDAIHEKLSSLGLRGEDIKAELERTGKVVRRKAEQAGKAIADATADARTTAAIKGKLLAERDLSSLSISVNTTDGVVTLSGTVNSPDHIGKAILLAMETDGVREVVSTLQVTQRKAAKT
jgi:osmotically-inducible protein OsmY